jgi:hypothetical protein
MPKIKPNFPFFLHIGLSQFDRYLAQGIDFFRHLNNVTLFAAFLKLFSITYLIAACL